MGRRQARREEGAYLNRYVTDQQRGRRPILNATTSRLFARRCTSWLARTSHIGAWARPARIRNTPCVILVFVRYSFASSYLRSPAGQCTAGLPLAVLAFVYPYTHECCGRSSPPCASGVCRPASPRRLWGPATTKETAGNLPLGNQHSTRSYLLSTQSQGAAFSLRSPRKSVGDCFLEAAQFSDGAPPNTHRSSCPSVSFLASIRSRYGSDSGELRPC